MLGIFAGFLMLLWLSDHMHLNIIYMIMHIHVEAGFRLLSPVQRKNVKASCPGMKIITKPSTKGIVLLRRSALVWANAMESSYLEATVFL